MKDRSFVEIEYIGRIAETDEIFDLTNEKLAKKTKIYSPNTKYGPISLIIGENMILKGLEDNITKMKPKESKKITLTPEEAFGQRDPKLLKVFSLAYFQKQKITPIAGQYITLGNDISGKVLSVSAGRVKIDFNHPLASKTLEYELTVNKEITDTKEKIEIIINNMIGYDKKDIAISVTDKKSTIELPNAEKMTPEIKTKISDSIKKYIKDIENIEITSKTSKVANTKK